MSESVDDLKHLFTQVNGVALLLENDVAGLVDKDENGHGLGLKL